MIKVKTTCPVPLFDKLVDNEPEVQEEPVPFRTYTRDQLKESIRKEITLILNHRQTLTFINHEPEDQEDNPLLDSVLYFGVKDFSNYNYRGDAAWKMRVEGEIVAAIDRFEPRLQDVVAEIQEFDEKTRLLSVVLWGVIVIDEVREQITFPVVIEKFADHL